MEAAEAPEMLRMASAKTEDAISSAPGVDDDEWEEEDLAVAEATFLRLASKAVEERSSGPPAAEESEEERAAAATHLKGDASDLDGVVSGFFN